MRDAVLNALVDAREVGRAVVLATRMESGEQAVFFPLDDDGPDGAWPMAEARQALLEDRSFVVEDGGGEVFLRAYNPPVRVILIGAVHIAQPLARMVSEAGYQPVVVDPRRAFATEERFPGVPLVHRWPAEALETLAPDHRTAVVTLSHDPKLDDPALLTALDTPAFYLGALGSRRTHARRRDRLAEAGASAADLDRIHAPVGLDLGARTPEEIAVSVLAEIVGALRRTPDEETG